MRPLALDLDRLDEVPGIAKRGAENILAETGIDLTRWPSVDHFTSWSGLCPGNKASGGRRKPARTRKGNPWLKRALTEAAWAAGRSKNSYLGVRFRQLKARIGLKRAVVTLAREILTIIYYLLTRQRRYADLGIGYLEERDRVAIERRATRQLQRLGYSVQLTPQGLPA